MSKGKRISLPHPLCGADLPTWLRILSSHGLRISPRYYARALSITAASAVGVPIRFWERWKHGRAIQAYQSDQPPVFIVGHWRSGTTNMHNLLLQDPSFASVSLLHCVMPHGFMTFGGIARRIMSRRLPKNRPMDDVVLGIDEPMSEDFGLVGITDLTHYLSYFFPQIAEKLFRESVLFEGRTRKDIERWQRSYRFLLQKVAYASGKRLLLKNPPNIGRIPQVLEVYPDAKFIHVLRNPYRVHASTVKLMDRFVKQFALQSYEGVDLEEFVSKRYQLIMEKWLSDKHAIPAENFIELRHEDIVDHPEDNVRRAYEHLNLPGFDDLQPQLAKYAESLSGYQNNVYSFDADYLKRVNPYLKDLAEGWGYEIPSSPQTTETVSV